MTTTMTSVGEGRKSPRRRHECHVAGPQEELANDSKIQALEKELVAECEKTCSNADDAIRTSQKLIAKKDSKKFKVQTTQRKK